MKLLGIGILFLIGVYATVQAYRKSKDGSFYSDTILTPLGIFVWGDGLIIGPFFIISSFVFLFLSPVWILRYILIFYGIRSCVEILYWVAAQFAKTDYKGPLLRNVSWLDINQAAILYQLFHMMVVTILLFIFFYSFS